MKRTITKIDMHSHTKGSDGMGTPEQIAREAKESGIHGLCLTDHHTNTTPQVLAVAEALLEAGIMPIIGCEYSTAQNHLLVYGTVVQRDRWGMYPEMQRVVDEVNAEGGACVVPHPFKGYTRSIKAGVERIRGLAAVEIFNGQVEQKDPTLNRMAASSAERMGARVTGSSDAHFPGDIGTIFTEFEGHIETVGQFLESLRRGTFRPGIHQARFDARKGSRLALEKTRLDKWSAGSNDWQGEFFGKEWAVSKGKRKNLPPPPVEDVQEDDSFMEYYEGILDAQEADAQAYEMSDEERDEVNMRDPFFVKG